MNNKWKEDPGRHSVVKENYDRLINKNYKGNTKYGSKNIDIKGAITLAITISLIPTCTYIFGNRQ